MINFKNLEQRGLLHDLTNRAEAEKVLQPGDLFYVGLDPTAPSLTIGNLMPLLVSIHLAQAGLRPLILFGGATGAIGDPSGKSVERQLLDRETITRNISAQQLQTRAIFSRIGLEVEFTDNLEWTKGVDIITFLRDVGKHFTVNYMLQKEVVKSRLDSVGISFTEFSYMLLQANDYHHLYTTRGCKLQIGGSDQWGNITAGLELIRKKGGAEAFALAWPLLTDSQGKKFGKSEAGAIWLDPTLTSPYKLHQFLLNTDDRDVMRYVRMLTLADDASIAAAEAALASSPEKRVAQNLLADSVCTLVHGESATQEARRSAQVLFGGSVDGLAESTLLEIFRDVPSSNLSGAEILQLSACDLLVHAQLAKSKGDARRLVESGGAYLNNQRIESALEKISQSQVGERKVLILRAGKKQYHLVHLS